MQSPALFDSWGTVAPSALSTEDVDVYFVNGQDSAAGAAAQTLQMFVANGGCLILAAQSWSWGEALATHPGNLVLNPMGVVFRGIYDWTKANVTVDPTSPPSQNANADVRLGCLDDTCRGATTSACYLSTTSAVNSAKALITDVKPFIPTTNGFWSRLQMVGRGVAQCGG